MKSAIEAAGPEVGEIKFFDDIIAPFCVEIDKDEEENIMEDVEYATSVEVRKALSKFFNYEEIDKLGDIKIVGDIVSPLYRDIDE